MSKSPLVSGARVLCYINGRLVGKVTGFRWSSSTPKRAIHGIDSVAPFELAPGMIRVTGTVSLFRLMGDGGIEGLGMAGHHIDVVRERYFTLTLIERTTGTTLFKADYCSVTDQSWDVRPRALVEGSVSFEGLAWTNEA